MYDHHNALRVSGPQRKFGCNEVPVAHIFISYRRSDTGYVARMLADRLQHQYGSGSVFLDVDNIPPGVDFRNHLDAAVAQCDVFLALIGNEWLSASESGVSRLEDARDFVRIELESALRRSIPVIPILTESAAMPREDQLPESLRAFAYRNGMELRAGADLEAHLARIVKGVQDSLEQQGRLTPGGRAAASAGRRAEGEISAKRPVSKTEVQAAKKTQLDRQKPVPKTETAPAAMAATPAGDQSFIEWSFSCLFLLKKPTSLAARFVRLLFFVGLVFLGGFWLLVLSLPLSDSQPRGSDLAVKLIMGGHSDVHRLRFVMAASHSTGGECEEAVRTQSRLTNDMVRTTPLSVFAD